MSFKSIGTTSPIYVSKTAAARPLQQGYFFIKFHSAQAVFDRSFWHPVRQLVVASRVALKRGTAEDPEVPALQRSRAVAPGQAENLGLASNLIDLTPTTVVKASIALQFLADRENRLAALSGLIESNSFMSVVSLAPSAVGIAKALGGLTTKILSTFFAEEDQKAVLQFACDFNFVGEGEKPGYYVILGTRDPGKPLPPDDSRLELRGGKPYLDSKALDSLSYVILELVGVPARTKDTGDGPWRAKLDEAETLWTAIGNNPRATQQEKETASKRCLALIQEAHTLIQSDPLYLPSEALAIIQKAYGEAEKQIFGTGGGSLHALPALAEPSRALLRVATRAELEMAYSDYSRQIAESYPVLVDAGILPPSGAEGKA